MRAWALTLRRRWIATLKYAVFSDSQSVIRRVMVDTVVPGQQWARATTEVCTRLMARQNEITILWCPAHKDVAGNEFADGLAKETAERRSRGFPEAPDQVRWQASLSHLVRRATERRPRDTTQWVAAHVQPERRYQPGRNRPSKEAASRGS